MEELRNQIEKELKVLEDMIKMDLDKNKIEKQKHILDELLSKYVKDL